MKTNLPKTIAWRSLLHLRLPATFTALFVELLTIGCACAQTCPLPTLLTNPEATYSIDTCQSTYSPQSLCGLFAPAGPAVAFQVNLAYPQPGLTVFVQAAPDAQFDPVIVVQSQQCGESGPCPDFVDDVQGPGTEETFTLNLDSGTYYLIVTSNNPLAPCGAATVGFEQPYFIDEDGIFRAGMNY